MEKKKLIALFVVAPLLIALIFVGIGKNCCLSGGSNQLEIVRGNDVSEISSFDMETDLENGLITKKYPVPRSFLDFSSVSDLSGDPFAEKDSGIVTNCPTGKTVLENAGIAFGTGAAAVYEINANTLIVRNTRDQQELVEVYIASLFGSLERQIAIRADIFEMPALTALEVIESAAAEGTHSPERDALRRILEKGKVRLVNAITIIARSGQRAKVEGAQDFPLPLSKTFSEDKEDKNGNKPDWEIRKIGTIFEVDPVLGTDDFTIDLNFSLEHHTAVPDLRHTKPSYPPALHAKKITTQITTQDGASILVGSWKPTGKPEYEKNDLMHLVFITANIQTPTAPMAIAEESEEK